MNTRILPVLATVVASFLASMSFAAPAAVQAIVDTEVAAAKVLAADPALVAAVKGYNVAPSAEAQSMTQEKWKTLTLLDPLVRSFSKNPAAEVIKARKSGVVTEAFLSGADGGKVAFLAKPSSWSHKGKAKHDDPMAGKVWQGEVEVDESTGMQQVQVAVPVLDGDKPIGSLVVGLGMNKMSN